TVLFTDVVNSTTLTQSLGDEAALALLRVHDTVVRDALSALGGREVKHTGDGIMASFVSTAAAVRCAIQIQRELDKHAQVTPERALKVRVGPAAGEPVEQNNDFFGSTVQLASRLCTHAQPEQILVSNAIAELCLGKGLLFEDLGEGTLKGFGYPVRAHAAAWKLCLDRFHLQLIADSSGPILVRSMTRTTAKSAEPEDQLRSFIEKFEPRHQSIIR